MPDLTNEMELVQRAKEGDPAAFSQLAERYMPVLHGRAGRYANIVGIDIEDYIQEGLLALFRAVKGFDPDAAIQFSTYAITCINNSMAKAIKTHFKDIRQTGAIHIDAVDEQELYHQLQLQADERSAEDIYIEIETDSDRQRQIEALLSEFERHVLQQYLSGQSYQTIAKALCTTTKAVDNALQRVRRKLRPEL